VSDRYGNRRVSKMLTEWNRLREAVREGNIEGIQHAFDACEEWIDFAFGKNVNKENQDGQ
jgi:ribosomal protein S20